MVRKEFKATGETQADYERELRNLSMLRLIKHSNIMEMLAAYTFKGRHNLIFPLARDKTLGDLLQMPRSSQFQSLEHIIVALSGLCSALHAVHNFVSPDFNLQAIGCHHDLKPDNILIDDGSLMLADFGLSKFKDLTDASHTSFKQVRGNYVAPECEDFWDLSKKKVIHRSSDIWSLGCIILELLTYMVSGPEGVSEFEESRAFKVENYTRHRFHRGLDAEAPTVTTQLDRLRDDLKSRVGKKLIRLIREILNLDPLKRPPASVVDAKMQHITIEAICEDVRQHYVRVFQKSESMQAWIALQKFTSWMRACRLDEHDLLEQWHLGYYSDFQTTRASLFDMRDALRTILPDCENSISFFYQPLHRLNDTLLAALSPDLQSRTQSTIRMHAIITSDESHVNNMVKHLRAPADQAELQILAKVRILSDLTGDSSLVTRPELQIDPSRIESEAMAATGEAFADGHTCTNLHTDSNKTIRIIIERKNYQRRVSKQVLAELISRLSKMTILLREAGPGFRLLPCSGFFHNPSQDSCGLVYTFPPSSVPASELKFTTLKAGLDKDHGKPILGLTLESRFQLAKDLAISLLRFHEAGWLQKNISSLNIGFFHHRTESWLRGMNKPYFLGYVNSRPNEASAYTEYKIGPEEKNYQHPDYLRSEGKARYRRQFDYYSLGLILLEIGRWESLGKMAGGLGSPEEVRDRLRKDKVPRLAQKMGSIYQSVVDLCLSDGFRSAEDTETATGDDVELQLRFSDRVVD